MVVAFDEETRCLT